MGERERNVVEVSHHGRRGEKVGED